MFKRIREARQAANRSWYVRSPGHLAPLALTQPGGPGYAEVADDGVRFFVNPRNVRYGQTWLFDETSCQRHHFRWEDVKGYEFDGEAVRVQMHPSGGGYLIVVDANHGPDSPQWTRERWEYLLTEKGGVKLLAR